MDVQSEQKKKQWSDERKSGNPGAIFIIAMW